MFGSGVGTKRSHDARLLSMFCFGWVIVDFVSGSKLNSSGSNYECNRFRINHMDEIRSRRLKRAHMRADVFKKIQAQQNHAITAWCRSKSIHVNCSLSSVSQNEFDRVQLCSMQLERNQLETKQLRTSPPPPILPPKIAGVLPPPLRR